MPVQILHMKVRFTDLIALLIAGLLGLANAYASDSRLYFTHFNSNSELSLNTVNCILQDRQGFIWIGTNYGLNRFDGIHFRQIENLPASTITTLAQDSTGLIWVGTTKGMAIYDPELETVADTPEKLGVESRDLPKGQIAAMSVDPGGRVVVVDDALRIYDPEKRSMRLAMRIDEGKTGSIKAVTFDRSGNVWLGTYGHGLYISDNEFSSIKKYDNPAAPEELSRAVITDIVLAGNSMLVATDNCGLVKINLINNGVERLLATDHTGHAPFIRTIMHYSPKEVWLGTESGIYMIDSEGHYQHYEHNYFDSYSLSDNAIYALLRDREGGVWVGSYFGGIDYVHPETVLFEKYYKGNPASRVVGQRVREMCEDGEGNIWIGSEDGGLSKFTPSTGQFSHLAESDQFSNIHGLCMVGDELWIGTFAKGLKILNTSTGALRTLLPDSTNNLISDYVFSICRTRSGDIYIGTISGVQRYNASTRRFETVNALRDRFAYFVKEDSKGNLWVGTFSSGLYMRPAGMNTWKRFSAESGLPSDRVIGFYEDLKGTIWVMTSEGLCSTTPPYRTFDCNFAPDHYINGIVYQMLEDKNGLYWLSTNSGLYRINPATNHTKRFSVADGLTHNQFNFASSLQASSGKLYFGGIDGFIAFDPDNSLTKSELKSPLITGLYLADKLVTPSQEDSPLSQSITSSTDLRLDSDQNSIAFDLSLLNYNNSPNTLIKYRLKGLESDWRFTTISDAHIAYPNTPSGSYTLELVSFNQETGDESEPTLLHITIATPFYLSAWAFLLYALIIAAVVYLGMRYYRRVSRENAEREIERRLQENERAAYDSKIRFFTNVAHEIRTPLTLIKAPLESVFKSETVRKDREVVDNLDVVNLNVERLLQLVNQLLDFRKMENGHFQIHKRPTDIAELIDKVVERFGPTFEAAGFRFALSKPSEKVMANVDPEAITKILSNLCTNAVKYGKSYIDISLKVNDKNFIVKVTNDGDVVAPDNRERIFTIFKRAASDPAVPGTGIGLSYSRSLAKMHSGYLVMDDDPERNTFILTIPTDSPSDFDAADSEDLEHLIKRNKDMATVLIVEDNEEVRNMLVKRITPHNYRVLTASDGQQAIKLLDNEYVDVVISDVMMPNMDGFELLDRIRSNVKTSHIPFILLTAKTEMRDKLEGLQLGADAYIEKPFSMEYLLANISTLLRNRERLRNRITQSASAEEPKESGLSEVDVNFLSQLNDIILANYSDPDFSMEQVFEKLGMSRTSFYRKIRGLLNQTPNDYIRIYRLKKAAELFDKGHTSVSEVCYLVGFSSPSYFSKCFQRQFGTTPKEYSMAGKRK